VIIFYQISFGTQRLHSIQSSVLTVVCFKKYCFAAKKLFFVKQNAIFAALLAIKQTLASLPCSIKNNQNKTMYQTILFEQFDGGCYYYP
jgi:hypothetical protein